MEYNLNEIEEDIRPEDFRQDSPWPEIIKICGPKFLVMLAKKRGGHRLYIPDQDYISKAARRRSYTK